MARLLTPARAVLVIAATAAAAIIAAVIARPAAESSNAVSFEVSKIILPEFLVSDIKNGHDRAISVFWLRNSSERSETITFAGASCACTGVYFDDRLEPLASNEILTLAPGERHAIRLQVSLQPSVYKGTYSAHFNLNNPEAAEKGEIQCAVSFSVIPDISIAPNMIVYEFADSASVVPVDRTVTVTIASRDSSAVDTPPIVRNLPREVRVLEIAPNTSTKRTDEEGLFVSSWDIHLNIAPNAETRGDGAAHLVQIQMPLVNNAALPIILRRQGGIECRPSVYFNTTSTSPLQTKRIVLRSRDGRQFQIQGVECPSQFSAVVVPSNSEAFRWVDITFKPNGQGNVHATIVIHTDHPDTPRISIEVSGDNEVE